MNRIKKFEESVNINKVYIVIDTEMHSYESIKGIYDSFDKAMKCPEWDYREETPDSRGYGETLFIYSSKVE